MDNDYKNVFGINHKLYVFKRNY